MSSSSLLFDLPDHFNSPASAAKDSSGNVYFSSPNLHNDLVEQSGGRASLPTIGMITPDNKLSVWYQFKESDALPASGLSAPMGIAFGPDGHLYVADLQLWFPHGEGESRILRIRVEGGQAKGCEVVASGFMFPNGIIWKGDDLYITDTNVFTDAGNYSISALYRVNLSELDAHNPLRIPRYTDGKTLDPHMFERYVSNGHLGFGANGVAIDDDGHFYVGIMDDGTVMKTYVDENGDKLHSRVFAQGLVGPDGMVWDSTRQQIFIADLFANAVFAIDSDGRVDVLAQNENTDGAKGELDAPSEVIVRGDELIVFNFDAVFDFPEMVNKSSEPPYTLSVIKLPHIDPAPTTGDAAS
ncbi:hypothetical protein HGP28_14230 [Vibrio sp. SM6]|uniref:SMP-30/Gluconolactonase/LRE-like region domain-containing protein n=1 Tax=Vibrio agarilyticus TaxID=2726741 RepID=A0A7X8YHF6_9VIBR|nr:hypothetical protein [Vibrio agarilyticus]NLS14048.1 hypothetical protein [Vibrio agarilyticus]